MIEFLWKLLAKFLVSNPKVTDALIHNAKNRPYFHLDGYMNRWWLTPNFLLTRDRHGNLYPYNWVPKILKCRVHHILTSDSDRHLHDHPFSNRSIVLRGSYVETDIFFKDKTLSPGDTVKRNAETFHKISSVTGGGVWTFWFMGRKKEEPWGFLVDNKKIKYTEYLKKEDKNV